MSISNLIPIFGFIPVKSSKSKLVFKIDFFYIFFVLIVVKIICYCKPYFVSATKTKFSLTYYWMKSIFNFFLLIHQVRFFLHNFQKFCIGAFLLNFLFLYEI